MYLHLAFPTSFWWSWCMYTDQRTSLESELTPTGTRRFRTECPIFKQDSWLFNYCTVQQGSVRTHGCPNWCAVIAHQWYGSAFNQWSVAHLRISTHHRHRQGHWQTHSTSIGTSALWWEDGMKRAVSYGWLMQAEEHPCQKAAVLVWPDSSLEGSASLCGHLCWNASPYLPLPRCMDPAMLAMGQLN